MTKKLPTINIKGKEYVLVKDRILAFNEANTNGAIFTEIVKNDDNSVVVRAVAIPDIKNPERRFVGHSEAYREGQMADVPIEVAETSAVGRALAMMGIGVLEGVASADEIAKSQFGRHADTMSANPISPKQKELIMNLCIQKGVTTTEEELNKLNSWQASQKINSLKKLPTKEKSNSAIKAEDSLEMDLGYEDVPTINE